LITDKRNKRVLVAPLNWGLGHATRCMPIINELLRQNVEVVIASDGTALELLKKEYPNLKYLELPAYNVSYRTKNMFWNIAIQSPKIAFAMIAEWFVLQKIIEKYKIDAVVSDNRYGCWTWKVSTAFMTHQVNIKAENRGLEFLINRWNQLVLRLFGTIWIPDLPNEPSLAGELSHGFSLTKVKYIGVLSRMKPMKTTEHFDIGIILSGPEPQRTFLEEKLTKQIKEIHKTHENISFLLVKGKTDLEQFEQNDNLEIHGYLTAEILNEKMAACDVIVARSGYSTVMDLAKMEKKAVFIPTPGQTEQEYLVEHLKNHGIYWKSQDDFELKNIIGKLEDLGRLKFDDFEEDLLEKVILDFLK
jgi:predicted glycosyltransferase